MSFISHVSLFSGLPLDVLQFASISCAVWPKAAVLEMWPHQCKQRGIIASLHLLFMLLLMWLKLQLVFTGLGVHCWLLLNLLSPRVSKSCSAELLLVQSA